MVSQARFQPGSNDQTMTFLVQPRRSSFLPMIGLSQHARGFLKEAAEMKRVGGQGSLGDTQQHKFISAWLLCPLLPRASFSCNNSARSTCSFGYKPVSPHPNLQRDAASDARSPSMCLSLIFTPCKRYTSCTSSVMYRANPPHPEAQYGTCGSAGRPTIISP